MDTKVRAYSKYATGEKARNNLRLRCSMHNGIIPMQENHIAQRSNSKSAISRASDAVERAVVAGMIVSRRSSYSFMKHCSVLSISSSEPVHLSIRRGTDSCCPMKLMWYR